MDEKRLKDFISTRSPQYKVLHWDKRLPSKSAAIAEMLRSPNLIRRPILIEESGVRFGFDFKRGKKK